MLILLRKFKKSFSITYKFLILLFYLVSFYTTIGVMGTFVSTIGNDFKTVLCALYLFVMFILSSIFGGFKIGQYRVQEIIYCHTLAILITNALIVIVMFLMVRNNFEFFYIMYLVIIQFLIAITWAFIGNKIYFEVDKPMRLLLIYGENPDKIIQKFIKKTVRYNVCKVICQDVGLENLLSNLYSYEGVIIYGVDKDVRSTLLNRCYELEKKIILIPDVSDIIISKFENLDLFDMPVFYSTNTGLSVEQRLLKRILDLLIIIPSSIIALPFMIVTSICIKMYDGGPVFYKQERLTLNGRIFNVYKFRSMKVDAEKNGEARLATKNDDRITPVGKIIRAIRFDELPQIINILKGDMSIVGPRPERPEIARTYMEKYPEFSYRLKVKAGLTGYAQVFGKYNTTPIDKVKLDVMYIKNYSLLLDIKMIIMTIKILFLSESTEGIEEGETNAVD